MNESAANWTLHDTREWTEGSSLRLIPLPAFQNRKPKYTYSSPQRLKKKVNIIIYDIARLLLPRSVAANKLNLSGLSAKNLYWVAKRLKVWPKLVPNWAKKNITRDE